MLPFSKRSFVRMRLRRSLTVRKFAYFLVFLSFIGLYFILSSSSDNTRVRTNSLPDLPAPVGGNDVLISYENHALAAEEAKRTGPGEQGQAVHLVGAEKTESEKFRNQNGFNIYISKMIALDRSVRDIRYPQCKNMLYSNNLPQTSVVIPFFDEDWNALLRTVVSAIKRAPPNLIKEIILVDDGSDRKYLKEELDSHVSKYYPTGQVKVIHSPTREGLITARIRGARAATGEVIVFLDSHCEPNPNWLPPLLDPIKKNYRTAVCPFIDVIDAETFEYRAQDEGARGAFDWQLYYKRLPKLASDNEHPEKPFDSPVMAGGLFAISTKWFWELGGYDPGLAIWGGEQYELSFKLWMCGGKMIDVPCSRIGHIYRKYPTNFPSAGITNFVGRNYKRVAEVWMDEYKEYIYNRSPHYRGIDTGNLSEQRAIRERLHCKSFKWFMTEVAFDLTKRYPLIDPIPAASGDIRPLIDTSLCVDALGASETVPIKLAKCVRDDKSLNGLQNFELSFRDDIRPVQLTKCWDRANAPRPAPIILFDCHGLLGNQHWAIEPVNKDKANPIIIRDQDTCLQASENAMLITTEECKPNLKSQQWTWNTLRIDAAVESRVKAGL